jgi:anti-sigma factor RsiW
MKSPSCASGAEVLMDYLEGGLSADERIAIEAHVTGCPRCAAFITSYRETPRIVREATTVAFPADLEASLLAALRAARRKDRDER